MDSNKYRITTFIEDFNKFNESNVKITNYEFTGCTSKYSNANFEIKELPDWLFGVWISQPDDFDKEMGQKYHLDVFACHKLFIDKFKPSWGDFNTKVRKYKFNPNHNEYECRFDIAKLDDYIKLLLTKPYVLFACGDDITKYDKPSVLKKFMKKSIKEQTACNNLRKKNYEYVQKWIRLGSKLKLIKVAYEPDRLNEGEDSHINDEYYIFSLNKLGRMLAKKINYKLNEVYYLGEARHYPNNKYDEIIWRLAYCGFYIEKDDCDLNVDELIELKNQYDYFIHSEDGEKRLKKLTLFTF